MIFQNFNLVDLVILVIALLAAITFHEFSHAFVANILGDKTAKEAGRLSLDPLAHLDLLGTLFLLLAGFGWGKPVPVNPSNFKNPVLGEILVALAGPLSNLILAAFLALILRFIPLPDIFKLLLFVTLEINLILMTFNLFPIPPLDGSKILQIFLSPQIYFTIEKMGILILFFLLIVSNFVYPIFPKIIFAVVGGLMQILIGQPPMF